MGQQTPGALIQGGVYSRACIFLKLMTQTKQYFHCNLGFHLGLEISPGYYQHDQQQVLWQTEGKYNE